MIRFVGRFLPAFVIVAAVAGCAQQPVASAAGAVPAASTPTPADLRGISPVLLRRARDRAYKPRFFFCQGSNPDWTTCLNHDGAGYSRVLFFCQVMPVTGSSFLGMQCIDAPHLSQQLTLEETGAHDANFNFAN